MTRITAPVCVVWLGMDFEFEITADFTPGERPRIGYCVEDSDPGCGPEWTLREVRIVGYDGEPDKREFEREFEDDITEALEMAYGREAA